MPTLSTSHECGLDANIVSFSTFTDDRSDTEMVALMCTVCDEEIVMSKDVYEKNNTSNSICNQKGFHEAVTRVGMGSGIGLLSESVIKFHCDDCKTDLIIMPNRRMINDLIRNANEKHMIPSFRLIQNLRQVTRSLQHSLRNYEPPRQRDKYLRGMDCEDVPLETNVSQPSHIEDDFLWGAADGSRMNYIELAGELARSISRTQREFYVGDSSMSARSVNINFNHNNIG